MSRTMVKKRDLLEHLKRDELVTLVDRFGVEVADRRSKDGLVDALSSSRRVPLADALTDLSRDRLKEICRALGLDDSGKEKTLLVERLVGGAPSITPSGPAPNANGKAPAVEVVIAPGETLSLAKLEAHHAGRQHRLRVVVGGDEGAALDHGRLVVRVRQAPGCRREDAVRDQLVLWYRGRAAERVGDAVSAWSRRTGLRPSKVSIASQNRRWGSCAASGELRLNWRIVGASKRLVEYVVAHELMHLRHPDHTPGFWRALAKVMPDFEERRAQLRAVGPGLVW